MYALAVPTYPLGHFRYNMKKVNEKVSEVVAFLRAQSVSLREKGWLRESRQVDSKVRRILKRANRTE